MPAVVDEIQDSNIWNLWQKLQSAYYNYGSGLNLPANTDPAKTYQWRYTSALYNQFREWGFDEKLEDGFINELIQYAISRKLLHKGLSVLCQKNVIDKIYKALNNKNKNVNVLLDLVASDHENLLNRSNGNILRYLLNVEENHYKITRLYESHDISEQYLALSINCTKALSKARLGVDKILVPSATRLLGIRIKLSDLDKDFKQILGNDLRGI